MARTHATARLIHALLRVWRHKIGYLAATLVVFGVSVYTLALYDLLPEAPAPRAALSASVHEAVAQADVIPELPVSIAIPKIGLVQPVSNPATTNVAVLDEALLSGTVRYPSSAKIGAEGNVIIFGHSSYLPVVHNKSFKAFNDIQKLAQGDRIEVTGETHTFVYVVDEVREADAGSDAIPLTVTGKILTLATCDSFGKPTDRFIVTAHFVESYPNAS